MSFKPGDIVSILGLIDGRIGAASKAGTIFLVAINRQILGSGDLQCSRSSYRKNLDYMYDFAPDWDSWSEPYIYIANQSDLTLIGPSPVIYVKGTVKGNGFRCDRCQNFFPDGDSEKTRCWSCSNGYG